MVSAEAHDTAGMALSAGQEISGMVSPYGHRFEHVVVGRRRQHRIDVRLALGSITEVDARAVVVGIFRGVAPSGPAVALDSRFGGAIGDFTRRRMFSGNNGELFMMPTGRHPLRADTIILAGLGLFDQFSEEALQLTAENVLRTCIRTNVEELATVLFGAGSGHPATVALKNLLIGFFRGLRDADIDHNFRRITLCETDAARYETIKEELLRLSSTELFQEVEVTFDEIRLPTPAELAPVARGVVTEADPLYLIVRDESLPDQADTTLSVSVLTAGGKATVISDTKAISPSMLARLLQKLERVGTGSFTLDTMKQFGDDLSRLVLPDRIASALTGIPNHHLVVIHDTTASRIPWGNYARR